MPLANRARLLFEKCEGVEKAVVDEKTQSALISFDPKVVKAKDLGTCFEHSSFTVKKVTEIKDSEE